VIDAKAPVYGELIDRLEEFLDAHEELRERPSVLIHILGHDHDHPEVRLEYPTLPMQTKWERLVRRFELLDAFTAVVIEGACASIGIDLLLAADSRIGVRGFRVYQAVGRSAVWPSMSLYRVGRQIGLTRARKLLQGCGFIDADRAEKYELVDAIVPDSAEAFGYHNQLVLSSNIEDVAIYRRLVNESLQLPFEDAVGLHLAACERALRNASHVS
jgi:isomerase DpgB